MKPSRVDGYGDDLVLTDGTDNPPVILTPTCWCGQPLRERPGRWCTNRRSHLTQEG